MNAQCVFVYSCRNAFFKAARDILIKAAAGDMCTALYADFLCKLQHGFNVNPCGLKQSFAKSFSERFNMGSEHGIV